MRPALVVVLALTLAACGGDTEAKNDYVAAVNRAQTDFVAVVDDSQSRLADNASNEDTATQLDMIRAAAAKVVTRLRGVKPPDEVRSLHNSLVREAEGLVVAFRKAATAYRSGDSSRILTAKVDLTNDVTKVNEQLNTTINELNRKLHD